MHRLIKNISRLYTPDISADYGSVLELTNVHVLIKDDIIEDIRPQTDDFSITEFDQIIDAGGCCLLPGFVDGHTHPVFWQTREHEFIMRLQGKTYEEIAEAGGGIRNSARSFRQADKQAIKELTAKRINKFFEYGTTTIEAKSGYGLTTKDEIKALEIISELNLEQNLQMVPTFLGAHEIPDEYREKRDEYIRLVIEEMIPLVAEKKLARYCDVFCEKGVFTVDETRMILTAAGKFSLKARIHADELSPFGGAELAAEMGAITADHLVQISEQGIRDMADKNVIPMLLPITTFFLRKDKYAPARKMIQAGCQIGIATDFNPGSAMTQNMQLAWSVAALKMGLLPGELLWSTTHIPAMSLDLDHLIGTLETGKQADMILLDIPNLDYLPYHLGINHVQMTIKKGKVVFRRDGD
jgi:imidazolonepropionase